ncbi:hypothetical protein FPV67DRAFT_1675931 [Lyophyllum atratum]|nr:hypothetical protein FPV67DRAFT_1675931 [Lyophyllum atratum]
MSVVGSTQAPRYTTLPDNDAPDSEPDEAWKQALRHKMEEDLTSMVADARKNLENDPDKEPASVIRPEHLSQEYHEAMKCIQTLFEGTFRVELERKRQERRSVTTRDTLPRWDKVLDREKKDIVDGIGDTQKDISGETSAEPEVQMRPVDNQGLGHVLAVQLPRQLGTPDVSQDIVVWGRQQDKKKQKGGEQQGKREEGVNEDERRRGQWRAPNEQPDHEQGQDHERGAEFPLRAASSRGSNDHDDNDFFDGKFCYSLPLLI